VEFRILGPLEAVDDGGRTLPLGGRRPRSIMATLVVEANRMVSTDRLVEEVWGSNAPRSAVATLQSYLSRLRHALEPGLASNATPGRLVTHQAGYELRADTSEIDARRFEALAAAGRAAAAGGDDPTAVRRLAEALELWRGPVLDGLDPGPTVRGEVSRLTELRLGVVEERLKVELALGHHADVVGELEALVAAHPLRERLHALRMLALYRSGRQADALAAFSEARRALVTGLGIEPGHRLSRLQQRMLVQDPTLGWRRRPARGRTMPATTPAATRARGSLPAPLASFVGRERERRAVIGLLDDARLVTLTGAGGCGKTQLALRVARDVADRFGGGAWIAELASRRDPALVPTAIAQALGLPEQPGRAVTDVVVEFIGDRSLLLILDNCEHLIAATAAFTADVLARCPALRVLATSREPLRIAGEHPWRVPSLGLPPDAGLDALTASDAARLFVTRAREVSPGFSVTTANAPAIVKICHELDGIPLALELAAARLPMLSADEIAARLDDRFGLLAHGRRIGPDRHQTLEAAIDWSYQLLGHAERRLLARLSVFAGGFTVDAVEEVCSTDTRERRAMLETLSAVADKSLIVPVANAAGPARHDLLETIRAFARARLGPGELRATAERHAEFFAGLAQRAAPRLTGPDQVRWLNRLHVEQNNLRAALTWSLRHDGGHSALRIAASAWWFWLQFGHVAEGSRWLDRVLTVAGDADPRLRQRVLHAAGRMAWARAETDQARRHLLAALTLARDLGDDARIARAEALLALVAADGASAMEARARIDTAVRLADRGDAWTRAVVHDAAGFVAWRTGRLEDAAGEFAESERCYLAAGDEWGACLARLGAARVARRRRRFGRAATLHRRNLERGLALTVSSLDFIGLPQDLLGLAAVASQAASHELAVELAGAAESLRLAVELPAQSVEREEHARALARARAALGQARADAALARGRSLGAQAAVAHALSATAHLAGR
jgi:predicted ATPase/DNA-binding SARP family transcriptional activator